MKTLSTLIFATALSSTLSACMMDGRNDRYGRDVRNEQPGRYESTNHYMDSKGTMVERQTSTEVDEDQYGHKKAVVKSKTTRDPKGLFNKTTTNKTKRVVEDPEYNE